MRSCSFVFAGLTASSAVPEDDDSLVLAFNGALFFVIIFQPHNTFMSSVVQHSPSLTPHLHGKGDACFLHAKAKFVTLMTPPDTGSL